MNEQLYLLDCYHRNLSPNGHAHEQYDWAAAYNNNNNNFIVRDIVTWLVKPNYFYVFYLSHYFCLLLSSWIKDGRATFLGWLVAGNGAKNVEL